MDSCRLALFSDLDGTLFNSRSEVSAENLTAIRRFIKDGGKFGIATGRSRGNTLDMIGDTPVNTPCVLYNGSGLYDYQRQRMVKTYPLDKKGLPELLEWCMKRWPRINLQIHTAETAWHISPKELAILSFINTHRPFVYAEMKEVLPKEWLKIHLIGDHNELEEVKRELAARQMDSIDPVFTDETYLEFLPHGVHKGLMLKTAMEELHREGRIVAAIGDYTNDLELLEQADISFAPANALETVLRAADHVTVSNNDNAVAAALEMLAGLAG